MGGGNHLYDGFAAGPRRLMGSRADEPAKDPSLVPISSVAGGLDRVTYMVCSWTGTPKS
jgi:hypothetical protein